MSAYPVPATEPRSGDSLKLVVETQIESPEGSVMLKTCSDSQFHSQGLTLENDVALGTTHAGFPEASLISSILRYHPETPKNMS